MKTLAPPFSDRRPGVSARAARGASLLSFSRPPIAPRPDCPCFTVELPPTPRRQLEGALSRRLRSLYPGDSATTRLDWLPNGRSRGAYLVVASTSERLGRSCAAERGFISSSALLKALSAREGALTLGLFVAEDWIEMVSSSSCRLRRSICILREGPLEADLARILERRGPDGERIANLVLAAADDRARAVEAARAALEGSQIRLGLVLSLKEALRRSGEASCLVFARPGRRLYKRYAAQVFLAALLVASLRFAEARYAERVEAVAAPLARELAAARAADAGRKGEELELARLEAAREAADKESRPGPYGLIADAVSRLGAGSRLLGFRTDGASVSLEAVGGGAFPALAAFQRDPAYASVRLDRAQAAGGGGERYSLSMRLAK